jgi:uncharacterized protein (TIGR02118 family)
MIKLTILFRKAEDEDAFEHFYNTQLAIMERLPSVARREVGVVFGAPGGDPAYHRMLELYFTDMDTLDAALRSDAGEQAGKHLMQYGALLSEVFFSEVYEEDGGATPGALPTQQTVQDTPSDVVTADEATAETETEDEPPSD